MAETQNIPLSSRSILLICQSEETLEALAAILQQAGENAVTARNAREAWKHVKSGDVGCVVVDINSAPTDSLVLFRASRASGKASQIPFLFLISNESPVLALEDGQSNEVAPDAWLALPCTADQFLKQIHTLLEYKPQTVKQMTVPPSTPASGSGPQGAITPDDLLMAKGSVFAGQLGILDVTKILSMIEPLRLTGVLKLADGKRYGQVHFVDGAVRHAQLHDIEGPDALFLLFHLKSGAFRFDIEAPTTKRSIVGNTMALLLEGLRQMDEAKAMIKSFQNRGSRRDDAAAAAAAAAQNK